MDWSTIAAEVARSVAVVAAINIPKAAVMLLLALAGKKKGGQDRRAGSEVQAYQSKSHKIASLISSLLRTILASNALAYKGRRVAWVSS